MARYTDATEGRAPRSNVTPGVTRRRNIGTPDSFDNYDFWTRAGVPAREQRDEPRRLTPPGLCALV